MRATRSLCGGIAVCALALFMPACESDGNFKLLGYTTRPNYDCRIHTVRVPIFENRTFIRGVEFDLTQAVIREIEQKTPYKVVGPYSNADTELTGTVKTFTKALLDVSQLNEVREAETTLAVEVVWRDLRTGEYLTKPVRRPGQPAMPELLPQRSPRLNNLAGPVAPTAPQEPVAAAEPLPGAGGVPPPAALPGGGDQLPILPAEAPILPELAKPPAVVIRAVSSFIPELGQSRTTALQNNVNSIAVQIVSMMETPW
jgi:hypothetical protein